MENVPYISNHFVLQKCQTILSSEIKITFGMKILSTMQSYLLFLNISPYQTEIFVKQK